MRKLPSRNSCDISMPYAILIKRERETEGEREGARERERKREKGKREK